MLKKRIIPTLLWKNFGLVKGKAFESWRRIGTVLLPIKVYNKRDVDELILLDIDANQDNGVMDFNTAGICGKLLRSLFSRWRYS